MDCDFKFRYFFSVVFFVLISFLSADADVNLLNCSNLNVSGEDYFLNKSIFNSTESVCINITADNITLDCMGNAVGGNSTSASIHGIYAENRVNLTIKNCFLTGWYYDGIYLKYSSGSKIINNTVNSIFWNGIHLYSSSGNTLSDNSLSSNGYGILLEGSNNTVITENRINSSTVDGIYLGDYSKNNNLTDNTVENNSQHGLYISILSNSNSLDANKLCGNNQSGNAYYDIYDADSNSGSGNTCDKTYNWSDLNHIGCSFYCNGIPTPLKKPCGCSNGTYNYTCGETINNSCTLNCNLNSNGTCLTAGEDNITIDGAGYIITGNATDYGIYLDGRKNTTIKNFNIYNFSDGILLYSSSNNILTNNTANNNNNNGIWLSSSSNNTLTGNTANNNTNRGIALETKSNNNTLTNNTANTNSNGINLSANSDFNNLIKNEITKNIINGVYFSSTSNNNTLKENLICENTLDVNDSDSNSGANNTCDTAQNWNDAGKTECTYVCGFTGPEITPENKTKAQVNVFSPGEGIYAEGSGFAPNTNITICVVNNTDQWSDKMKIPDDVRENCVNCSCNASIQVNASGNFGPIYLWGSKEGYYDIIADQDHDGYYNKTKDAIESASDYGFYVTPEPLTIFLFFAGFLVLYGFIKSGKRR